MEDDRHITDFEAFWLFYLREHAKPETRALHYAGTGVAVLGIAAAIVLGKLWFLLAVPVAGFGPAWIAHVFIEKNKTSTLAVRPLWSLACDFRMTFVWLTGQLADDLKRAGVSSGPTLTKR